MSTADRLLLKQVLAEVRRHTYHDFRLYETTIVLRRIARRMRLRHVRTLDAYLEVLRTRVDEPRTLASDLLINVSEFFREPELYARLEQNVLPQLYARTPGSRDRLRVWSIGGSTGEEAYSLAILLLELAEQRDPRPQLQVFASDLSEAALHSARVALYPREITRPSLRTGWSAFSSWKSGATGYATRSATSWCSRRRTCSRILRTATWI